MSNMEGKSQLIKDQEDELTEKAELLIKHQKEQYESSVERIRRLEDKALKTFGSLSIVITVALLVVRYWWKDIFPEHYTPLHAFCWFFLIVFISTCFISWGFAFSAMQLQDLECPSSDATEIERFYMGNKIYNSLSAYAKEYSRLTGVVDKKHIEKSKVINFCFESMLYSAWSFVFFLILVVIIKLN